MRKRQAQMYNPHADTLVKCYKTEPSTGIFNMGQPTRGQGGTVRKVQVMSSDDEKRMAMSKAEAPQHHEGEGEHKLD